MKQVQNTGVATLPSKLDVECNGMAAVLLIGPPVMIQLKDCRVITPAAYMRESGSRLRNWRSAILVAATGTPLWEQMEGEWEHVREFFGIRRARELDLHVVVPHRVKNELKPRQAVTTVCCVVCIPNLAGGSFGPSEPETFACA